MKTTITLIAILIMSITNCIAQTQTLVSEAWAEDKGSQNFFQRNVTVTDANRNVYIAGATLNGNGDYDLLLTKYDDKGNELWTQQVDGNGNGDDFATAVFIDASSNVYVTGSEYESSTNLNDIIVLKFNSSGTLQWDAYYNGASSDNDAGGDIAVDGSGNVYVTGATYSSNQYDFITVKLNSSGSQQWVSQWDNVGLNDAANKISLDGGMAIVAGGTQINSVKWQYAIVKYDASDGSEQGSAISGGSNTTGIDKVTDITKDASGNIYVTGGAVNVSTGYDCYTIKLDDQLNVLWTATFDGSDNLDDVANSIDVDSQGNVYICGYTTSTTEGKNYLLIKYDAGGNEQWIRTHNHLANGDDEAVALAIKSDTEIILTGSTDNGNDADYTTLKYTDSGDVTWLISYDGGYNDKATDIAIDNNGAIIVAGQSTISGALKYLTVKYEETLHDLTVVNDFSGTPDHIDNEIIVRFQPSAIIPESFDNKNKRAGLLSDFITANAIQALQAIHDMDYANLRCYKVIPKMTTRDTLSISRSGRGIQLPPFYATLGILLPTASNECEINTYFQQAHQFVQQSALNHVFKLDIGANDPEYTVGNMASLVPTTTYPNANINIEPAWDIETGNPNIKVGVYDSGINFYHSEFGNGTFAGSKIGGGHDYYFNLPLNTIPVPDGFGHGTACAGIIAAFRNNNFGVAGVAGGDALANNKGVTLYDMKIAEVNNSACFPGAYYSTTAIIHSAIIEGAVLDTVTGFGFGLDVQNHSWSGPKDTTIQSALRIAFANDVVMSCSSGNDENAAFAQNAVSWPSTYKDEWVMKVGANDTTGARAYFSNGRTNLDYIAPGVWELYTSVDRTGSGLTHALAWGPSCTAFISGTSFAAPHAAGVSALMLSYVNNNPQRPNNLQPEDCEQLMQLYATDITAPPNSVGWDNQTGWGRINAGATMQGIVLPNYKAIHFNFTVPASTAVLDSAYQWFFCDTAYPNTQINGIHECNRYKITATNSHSLPASYALISGWKRDVESNLKWIVSDNGLPVQFFHRIPSENEVQLDNYSLTSATMTGYIYQLIHWNSTTGQYDVDGWYPFDTSGTAKFAYTLYVRDTTVGIDEITSSAFSFYPNPADNSVTLFIPNSILGKYKITLNDITGRLIKNFAEGRNINANAKFVFDVGDISEGMYFITLATETKRTIHKLIVNR